MDTCLFCVPEQAFLLDIYVNISVGILLDIYIYILLDNIYKGLKLNLSNHTR